MAAGDTSAQKIWIDGVEVPREYSLTGTATALVQGTTALVVGAEKSAGTNPLDGKIAQAAVFSAQLSDATIKAMMNQTMTGSETNLVSAYTFNGATGINDLSANANNLTAQGSALATDTDTPFTNSVTGTSVTAGTTNYGIITAQTFSTNTTYTVQVPEGETLPTTGGIGEVYYSTHRAPYGFPAARSKWFVETILKSPIALGASSATWYSGSSTNSGSAKLAVPIGEWNVGYYANIYTDEGTNSLSDHYMTLCRTAGTETDKNFTTHQVVGTMTANVFHQSEHAKEQPVATTSLTDYFLMGQFSSVNNNPSMCAATAPSYIKAECAYI